MLAEFVNLISQRSHLFPHFVAGPYGMLQHIAETLDPAVLQVADGVKQTTFYVCDRLSGSLLARSSPFMP